MGGYTCKTVKLAVRLGLTLGFGSLLLITGCDEKEAAKPADSSTQTQGVQSRRHIPLDGQPNFRDLGGYETVDGRTVKWGQVYRSGELPRLTDADVERVAELGIKTVVSFLTAPEIEYRGPDRLPPGVREMAIPIDTKGALAAELVEARKNGDFSKVPVELNPQIHAMLPDVAREQYAKLFRVIAKPDNQPIVFHCSHGVHRTGTAAAVLLWALGVPWETIRADYLLSNECRREETEKRLEQLRGLAAKNQGIPPEDVDMTNINAFYILQGEYIDATRDWILAEYGSIDAYLREGLGLKDEEVARLRDSLLD